MFLVVVIGYPIDNQLYLFFFCVLFVVEVTFKLVSFVSKLRS